MRHQAFDGVREIVVRVAGGVIRDGADHASLLRAGEVEVARGPGDDGDVVEIVDAARLHGALASADRRARSGRRARNRRR